jgi:hypothetical protein
MEKLLSDEDFFEEEREALGTSGKESVWQAFFEANQWIFGYGLNYMIGEGVDPSRLEQVVAGYTISGAGKRADALLRTRGIVRSLCYVEIKTHKTPLMHDAAYRPEVWRPSSELAGGVAQSQKTVQLAMEHLRSETSLSAGDESLSGHLFNYAPRSLLVCGSLAEFAPEGVVAGPRFSSFELYRRSLHSPDIVTFDELYERASAIVEVALTIREASEATPTTNEEG